MSAGLSATEFLAGWAGGSAGILSSHPLDIVRTRLQTHGSAPSTGPTRANAPRGAVPPAPGIGRALRSVWRNDGGARGMLRGIFSPLVTVGAWKAVVFSTFSVAAAWLQPPPPPPPPSPSQPQPQPQQQQPALGYCRHALASALGGFAGCFLSNPVELVKCRLQVDRSLGPRLPTLLDELRAARAIAREHGLARLYRGFGYSALAACPSYAVWFPLNDALGRAYAGFKLRAAAAAAAEGGVVGGAEGGAATACPPPPPLGAVEQLLVAGVSGGISWVAAFPGDKLKAIVMTSTDAQLSVGHVRVFRGLYAAGGQRWLWRGLGATVLRGMPQCAFTMLGYNQAKALLEGNGCGAGEQ
jgi:hypothetical protein